MLRRVNPTARLFLAAVLLAAWMLLTIFGIALGGAIHLLAVVALILVPWRPATPTPPEAP